MIYRQKLFFGILIGVFLVSLLLFFSPFSMNNLQGYLLGKVHEQQQEEISSLDADRFFIALQKRDKKGMEEILKMSKGKGIEVFLSDFYSFSRIENISSESSEFGTFISFFATKKTDLLHPYAIFLKKNGELVYKESAKAKRVSFAQLTGKSEALLQNLGPFPWNTKDVWRELGTGEIIRVFSPTGKDIVEEGEMMRVEGGLLEDFSIENLDRGFLVEIK